MEKKLERAGVRLPRATQVSLMQQLNKTLQPMAAAIKGGVMKSGYIQLDPTPVPLCDPAHPGGTVESTIWGYRAVDEDLVWYQFEYERGKSPDHPNRELKAANFKGKLQVDGANGLNRIGIGGQVIALGCHAHGRRYAYDAVVNGDENARVYLELYNKIFKIDRIAKRFKFGEDRRHAWRLHYSVSLFDLMVAMAEEEIKETMPDTLLWDCLHYVLGQQEFLRMLIAQLENQDPLNPLPNTEFIAQTAQFTSLEHLQNIAIGLERLLSAHLHARASRSSRVPGSRGAQETQCPISWRAIRYVRSSTTGGIRTDELRGHACPRLYE